MKPQMSHFVEQKSNHARHRHMQDDADVFREQNLRAIRRRKLIPKILMWIMSILAVIVVAAVFVAYFVDN